MKYHIDNGLLFPLEELADPGLLAAQKAVAAQKTKSHQHRKTRCNNLDLCLSQKGVGKYEMPPLNPYNGEIPLTLLPFNEALTSTTHQCGVHFYIDDYQFERIWTDPYHYARILKRFACVIGPDFSQYADMPFPNRIWNSYRNRVLSGFYQMEGINLIPNVTWSLPDSYDYSFDGMPSNSIIAINCTGIINNPVSKCLWYKGYYEAIKRLKPKAIIRYGTKMEGEVESISYYFENERLNRLRNGR